MPRRKVNYLNNKDILEEIHKSKTSFCSFEKEGDDRYDIIVNSLEEIDYNKIQEAKQNRAQREENRDYEDRKQQGERVKQADCKIDPDSIPTHGLTFRVMTFDHIPDDPDRKKNPKTTADTKVKLNFPPFQHWQFNENHELACVGKSHWTGDVHTGEFCKTHGQATQKLANMWMKLVNRCATKGNVRGYCVDEKTEALTKRGWVGIDDIATSDEILSYDQNDDQLKWSNVHSVYEDNYNNEMYYMSDNDIDIFVTPEHKMVTDQGFLETRNLPSEFQLLKIDLDSDNFLDSEIHYINRKAQDLEIVLKTDRRIWCPETDYGCFVARRNGTIYLTGNSYNDEMRGQAILQLTQIGLQFDESKSSNPFAYYTAAVQNSFIRVINTEKRNQNIRDDILEMNDLTPSHTRQHNSEWENALKRENQSNTDE